MTFYLPKNSLLNSFKVLLIMSCPSTYWQVCFIELTAISNFYYQRPRRQIQLSSKKSNSWLFDPQLNAFYTEPQSYSEELRHDNWLKWLLAQIQLAFRVMSLPFDPQYLKYLSRSFERNWEFVLLGQFEMFCLSQNIVSCQN